MNPLVRQAHGEWTEKQEQDKAAEAAAASSHATRRSLRNASSGMPKGGSESNGNWGAVDSATRKQEIPPQDFTGFFAALNVNLRVIADIAREMVSFYTLYDRLKEDSTPSTGTAQAQAAQGHAHFTRSNPMHPPTLGRTLSASFVDLSSANDGGMGAGGRVEPAFLVLLHARMRMMREADLSNPSPKRPVVVNKLLEV